MPIFCPKPWSIRALEVTVGKTEPAHGKPRKHTESPPQRNAPACGAPSQQGLQGGSRQPTENSWWQARGPMPRPPLLLPLSVHAQGGSPALLCQPLQRSTQNNTGWGAPGARGGRRWLPGPQGKAGPSSACRVESRSAHPEGDRRGWGGSFQSYPGGGRKGAGEGAQEGAQCPALGPPPVGPRVRPAGLAWPGGHSVYPKITELQSWASTACWKVACFSYGHFHVTPLWKWMTPFYLWQSGFSRGVSIYKRWSFLIAENA